MIKGLEALERLNKTAPDYVFLTGSKPTKKEDISIVEQELKALEIIKREPSTVIEIITTYDTWKEYIKDYPISDKTIWHIIKNKSEFDLLKEVLND